MGLVGISGAGKSTLVSLLLRYFELNSGHILIDGQNTADFSKNSVTARSSFENSLLAEKTLPLGLELQNLSALDLADDMHKMSV